MARTKRIAGYRDRIIRAASKLIVRRGIAYTSLNDIAAEMHISKGTLYYYYRSKSELIFEITERHIQRITAKLFNWLEQSGAANTPEEVLEQVIRTFVESETHAQMHAYLIQEAFISNPALMQRFRTAYDHWTEMMERGIQQVLEPSGNYAGVARLIIATLDGALLQRLLNVPKIPLKAFSHYLTQVSMSAAYESQLIQGL